MRTNVNFRAFCLGKPRQYLGYSTRMYCNEITYSQVGIERKSLVLKNAGSNLRVAIFTLYYQVTITYGHKVLS